MQGVFMKFETTKISYAGGAYEFFKPLKYQMQWVPMTFEATKISYAGGAYEIGDH